MVKTPGNPVRGSSTGRPIMVLLDVLGQKWTLRILWELRHASLTFRTLRERCDDVSPTLLNTRLKALRTLGLIDLGDGGYGLTRAGEELAGRLASLDQFAEKWAAALPLSAPMPRRQKTRSSTKKRVLEKKNGKRA